MRVLVTGATGFVGSTLVRELMGRSATVRVLVRDRSRLERIGPDAQAVDVIEGDVTDPDRVADAMTGIEVVYHCAAFVGFEAAKGVMEAVNVHGTAIVADAAREAGVRRLVHTSSVAALGRPVRPAGCLNETATWTPSRFNTRYARSKHRAELEIHRAVAEGLDAVMVNPSLIMGPGRPGENTMRIVESVRDRRMPAIPTGSTNVVDVEDVVAGMIAAMERGQTAERYLLAGENLSWREVITGLANALDVQAPRRTMPPRLALVLGALGEAAGRITGRPALITRETARMTAYPSCYDASRARSELGVSFRPFQETAERAARAARADATRLPASGASASGASPQDPGAGAAARPFAGGAST